VVCSTSHRMGVSADARSGPDEGLVDGLFSTAAYETPTDMLLRINGSVPPWLDGDYLKQSASRDNAAFNDTGYSLRRYTLHIANASSDVEVMSMRDVAGRPFPFFELPTINMNFAARQYCYAYLWAPHARSSSSFGDTALVKKNLCNDTAGLQLWQRPNHYPSEPVFVPQPGGTEEDAGVVLSAVFDGEQHANYLLVLDGKTMSVLATAYCTTCESQHTMAFGIHGRWFPRNLKV